MTETDTALQEIGQILTLLKSGALGEHQQRETSTIILKAPSAFPMSILTPFRLAVTGLYVGGSGQAVLSRNGRTWTSISNNSFELHPAIIAVSDNLIFVPCYAVFEQGNPIYISMEQKTNYCVVFYVVL